MPIYTQKMMLVLLLGLVATLFASSPSYSNAARCAKRTQMIVRLNERFGESLQSMGLTANGQIIETFAHPDNGTWTILLTFPNGTSCMVASGQDFQVINEPAGKKA